MEKERQSTLRSDRLREFKQKSKEKDVYGIKNHIKLVGATMDQGYDNKLEGKSLLELMGKGIDLSEPRNHHIGCKFFHLKKRRFNGKT
jgi:hypothetical protein